jgi:hypothetical protein
MMIGTGCAFLSLLCIAFIHFVLRRQLADPGARATERSDVVRVNALLDDDEADIYSMTSSEYIYIAIISLIVESNYYNVVNRLPPLLGAETDFTQFQLIKYLKLPMYNNFVSDLNEIFHMYCIVVVVVVVVIVGYQ